MAVVGGLSSIWGPIFGVTVVTVLTEGLKSILPQLLPWAGGEYEIVVFGFILVIIMIFLPEGLTAGLTNLYEGLRPRKERVDETS